MPAYDIPGCPTSLPGFPLIPFTKTTLSATYPEITYHLARDKIEHVLFDVGAWRNIDRLKVYSACVCVIAGRERKPHFIDIIDRRRAAKVSTNT